MQCSESSNFRKFRYDCAKLSLGLRKFVISAKLRNFARPFKFRYHCAREIYTFSLSLKHFARLAEISLASEICSA